MQNVRDYKNDLSSFHRNIREGSLEGVKTFLDKYQNEKHAYDAEYQSSVAIAVRSEQVEIYKLLIMRGQSFGPHEDINEIEETLPDDMKLQMLDILKPSFRNPNLKYLIKLQSMSNLFHSDIKHQTREFLELIVQAFEDLNDSKLLSPILKVVATSSVLKIVFDFKRDFEDLSDEPQIVNEMTNPPTEFIYIAAKGLLDENKRCMVHAVLAQKLCHHAMKLLYDNDCKPYRKGDDEMKQQFSRIVMSCKRNKTSEEVIESVYQLSNQKTAGALIARIPYIVPLYKDQPEDYQKCSETFPELLEFYENCTLVDLRRESPSMEARCEVIELNDLLGVANDLENSVVPVDSENLEFMNHVLSCSHKIQNISSEHPFLKMVEIHRRVESDKRLKESCIFVNFMTLKNDKIFNLIAKTLHLCIEPLIFINSNGQSVADILKMIQDFSDKRLYQRVIFVSNCDINDNPKIENVQTSHFMPQLSDKTREAKENQGNELSPRDIYEHNSEASDSISLEDLQSSEQTGMDKKISFDRYLYVERLILPSDAFIIRNIKSQTYDVEYSADELAEIADQQKFVLLADEPGMGKTTFFKMMTEKLKKKFPKRWVAYIDLRDFANVFRDAELFKSRKEFTIARFMSEKILKLDNRDNDLFTSLFNKNLGIFLIDGFDGIDRNSRKFVFILLEAIETKTNNQLWFASRPYLPDRLKKLSEGKTFKLKPFSIENQEDFFCKCLAYGNLNEEEMEVRVHELNYFMKKLLIPNKFTPGCSPLLMRMIAELVDDDLSIELTSSSYYLVYQKLTEKLFENAISCRTTIKSFHQKKALQKLFVYDDSKTDECLHVNNQLYVEDVIRVGLMRGTASGELKFIHRTFAEYFVARFLFEKLFQDSCEATELVVDAFTRILSYFTKHRMIRTFLDNALESVNLKDASNKIRTSYQSLDICFESHEIFPILELLTRNGCVNLLHIVSKISKDKNGNFHRMNKLWLDQKVKEQSVEPDSEDKYLEKSILVTAIECQSFDFLEKFWKQACSLFSTKKLKYVFSERNSEGENVFQIAVKHKNCQAFKFLEQKSKSYIFNLDFDISMNAENKKGLNVYSLFNQSTQESPNGFLKSLFSNEYAMLDTIFLQNILTKRDLKGKNIFFCALEYKNIGNFQFLIEISKNFISENDLKKALVWKGKNNLFSILHKVNDVEFFENLFLVNFGAIGNYFLKQIFLEKDENGLNVLQFSVKQANPQILKFLLTKVLSNLYLSKREISMVLTSESQNKKSFWANFFDAASSLSYQFFETVLVDDYGEFNDFFHKEIFTYKLNFLDNILHCAVSNENHQVAKLFVKRAKLWLSNDEFKALLTAKGTKLRTVLFYAMKNENSKAFEYVLKVGQKNLNEEEFRTQLQNSDSDGFTLLHLSCSRGDPENLKTFLRKLDEYLEPVEATKMIFQHTKDSELTALMLAVENQDESVLEALKENVLKEKLTTEALREFLSKTNKEGKTALHFAMLNENDKIFCSIRNFYKQSMDCNLEKLITNENANGDVVLLHEVEKFSINSIESLWKNLQLVVGSGKVLKQVLLKKNKSGKNFFDRLGKCPKDFYADAMKIFALCVMKNLTIEEQQQIGFFQYLLNAAKFESEEYFKQLSHSDDKRLRYPFFRQLFLEKNTEGNIFQITLRHNRNVHAFFKSKRKEIKSFDLMQACSDIVSASASFLRINSFWTSANESSI